MENLNINKKTSPSKFFNKIKIINKNIPGIPLIIGLFITVILYISFIISKTKKSQSVFIIPTFIIIIFFITICSFFISDFNTLNKIHIYVFPLSIGILISIIFYMVIMLIVNKDNNIDNFYGGTCYNKKLKKFGELTQDGICIIDNENNYKNINTEENKKLNKKKNDLKNLQKICKKKQKELSNNIISESTYSNKKAIWGPCLYNDPITDQEKWGYRLPEFGNKCITMDRYKKYVNNEGFKNNNLISIKGKKGIFKKKCGKLMKIIPSNMTKCDGHKNKYFFDKQCKKEYGKNFGLKEISSIGCGNEGFRGICGENYNLGYEVKDDTTKCYPIGTDMNLVCNNKMKFKNNIKNINFGYEKIISESCPKNFIRAKCSDNFYDGRKLLKNQTNCYNQNFNSDRMCKKQFGELSFSIENDSSNCLPGYIRSKCQNNS